MFTTQWHSNNWLLATGCSDFKCRLFAANISSVDAGVKRKFGELLMEVDCAKNWIHGLAWSPSCASLAICAQDSCLHVVDVGEGETPSLEKEPKVATVKFPMLPQCATLFLTEDRLVTVGFHKAPLLFKKDAADGKWVLEGELNAKDAKGKGAAAGSISAKMGMFGGGASAADKSKPTYARVRTDIKALTPTPAASVSNFSVSGMAQEIDQYTL